MCLAEHCPRKERGFLPPLFTVLNTNTCACFTSLPTIYSKGTKYVEEMKSPSELRLSG